MSLIPTGSLAHALKILEDSPAQLEYARARFDRSPASPSRLTVSDAADETFEEDPREVERANRRYSRPPMQFLHEAAVVREHIEDDVKNKTRPISDRTNFIKFSKNAVKDDWVEQGIWDEEWDSDGCPTPMPGQYWMHEQPPVPSTRPTTDATPSQALSNLEDHGPWTIQSHGDQIEQMRKTTKKLNNEPSRPFHQFIHRVSKERERLQNFAPEHAVCFFNSADISTKAYTNVKEDWVSRGLWNEEWGILPGMLWKHESPWELRARDPTPELAKSPNPGARTCTKPEVSKGLLLCPPVSDSPVPRATRSGVAKGPKGREVARKRSRAIVHGTKTSNTKISTTKPPASRLVAGKGDSNLGKSSDLPMKPHDTELRRSRRLRKD